MQYCRFSLFITLLTVLNACKSDEPATDDNSGNTITININNSVYGTATAYCNGTPASKVADGDSISIYATATDTGYFYQWIYTLNGIRQTSITNPLIITGITSDITVNAQFIDASDVLFVDDFEQDDRIPDSEKWILCQRGSSDWNNTCSDDYDLAYIENGKLILEGIKEGSSYKTGAVQWAPTIGFEHVRIEVTARLATHGYGQWPAIWMMPRKPIYSGWPSCGEIDIMEHLNLDTFYYTTIHSYWVDTSGNRNNPQYSTTIELLPGNRNDWNTYAMQWDDNAITFYLNGVETFSYANLHLANETTARQWPFNTTFYLILSQQLGGSWVGSVIDNTLPAIMEIDRVLVTALH